MLWLPARHRRPFLSQCNAWSVYFDQALGPSAAGLPTWRPPPGYVGAVSLNIANDVDPEDDPLVNPDYPADAPWHGVSGMAGVFDAWTGGVWAPDYSALGGMVFYGGGHTAYYGNQITIWNASTQLFERINNPTYPWSEDYVEGELQPGKPMATHTYGMVGYLPAASGGGTKGSFILLIHSSNQDLGGDFTGRSHICDLATGVWSRFSTNLLPATAGPYEGTTCFDASRNEFSYIGQGFTPLAVLNSSRAWGFKSNDIGSWNNGTMMAMDSTGDLKIILDVTAGTLKAIDPASSTGATTTLTQSGSGPPSNSGMLEYVAAYDAFYYWIRNGLTIYKLTPPAGNKAARLAGTWTWSSETLSYVPGTTTIPNSSNSFYSRFRYAPAIKSFITCGTVTGKVYAMTHSDFGV